MRANPQAQSHAVEGADEKEIFQHFVRDQTLRSESDTALSAFAQLTTLRLNVRWALISLIDGTNQYILVEATQNSRLRLDKLHDDEEEGFLFGRKTLARSLGLCGNALDILSSRAAGLVRDELPRPSLSPLIIDDVMSDKRFRSLPFVASHPSVRFFAAMPIITKSSFYIGTISVMDERPREGLSDDEIHFLSDVGLTIIANLEMIRVSEVQRRSGKMIKGLGVFMEGRTNLQDWWLELGNNQPRVQDQGAESEGKNGEEPDVYSGSVSRGHIGAPSSPHPSLNSPETSRAEFDGSLAVPDRLSVSTPTNTSDALATTMSESDGNMSCRPSDSKLAQPRLEAPAEAPEKALPPTRERCSRTFTPDMESSLIPERLKELFSRAGHIIQESTEADGVLFLDARVSTLSERSEPITSTETGGRLRNSTSGSTSSSVLDSTDNDDTSQRSKTKPSVDSRGGGEEPSCGILGLWTSENSSLHGDRASNLIPLKESVIQTLLHKYPQGHIFTAGKRGAKYKKRRSVKSSEQSDANTLSKMFPGARSIAFVPLWDPNKGRWFAGSFMWTVLPTHRVLTCSGDLNYLAAFGNSLMAEVARLDVVGMDRAKSDFISSISHELRSPLHGILASAELLHDTTVDFFQHSMIETIERCGRTLLDTIQHVLDFAKINNFIRAREDRGGDGAAKGRPGRGRSPSGVPNLIVNVDLSMLAEDVVDSVFVGHEFQGNSALFVTDEASGFPPEGLRRSGAKGQGIGDGNGLKKERIEVILDIGWRPNWIFRTESGALRRVLMNLFGNALKYTDKGWVKVSLQATDTISKPGQPAKSVVRISISDTGRGIAQEYLHSGLFTPFTQENPLNPGTGLGLSIVLQIVRSLGGQICITSEQDVGTEVVVTLTMDQAQVGDAHHRASKGQEVIQRAKDKTKGLRIGLVALDVDPGIRTRRPGRPGHGADTEPLLLLQASIDNAATQWFGMEATASSTWKLSPPDIYVANEHPGHGASAGVPTIVLCSHEELHREYGRRTTRGVLGANRDLVHFVSRPCGPHKLAKAFLFCLGSPAHSFQGSLFPRVPSKILTSPQSLFQRSPEYFLSPYEMEPNHQDGYFAPSVGPEAVEAEISTRTTTTAGSPSVVVERKRKPKLLLVEDNEINLRLLSMFVKKSNFGYDTAENGLEAVQAFEAAERQYDIIIMDITMPVMDGMQATREIRKLEHAAVRPQRPPVMVVALTGLGSVTSQKEAFDSGVDMFLTKPVRLKDLRKTLDDWKPDGTGVGMRKLSS